MKVGDTIESIHTRNKFIIEYISNDGFCFIVTYKYKNEEKSRCYDKISINRSFRIIE